MRVLFLIITSNFKPYLKIQKRGQEKTWIKTIAEYENVDYRYLISDGLIPPRNLHLSELHTLPSNKIAFPATIRKITYADSTSLKVHSSKGWESILFNTLSGFQWSLDHLEDFDFVIRTNVSSYWNIENTLHLLKSLANNGVYAGHTLNSLDTSFIAGDGIILSRDLVELICNQVSKIDSGVIEDVSIGRFLHQRGIIAKHFSRPIVHSLFDCNNPQIYENRTHQVRCKMERNLFGKNYRIDTHLMQALHRNFQRYEKGPNHRY